MALLSDDKLLQLRLETNSTVGEQGSVQDGCCMVLMVMFLGKLLALKQVISAESFFERDLTANEGGKTLLSCGQQSSIALTLGIS